MDPGQDGAGAQAPQYMIAFMNQQAEMIRSMQDQQRSMQDQQAILMNRLAAVESQGTVFTVPERTATPLSTDAGAVRRPKPSLPHPDKFDGENLMLFPQFEGNLQAKLFIDGAAIRGEMEKVWYAYGRLSGRASTHIYP